MKLLSLFSGIGAFEKALTNLDISYELVGFSEIDKWAIESYSAIHNVSTDLNLGDVSKITSKELINDIDIITHGSPCQDYSIAGRGKGGDKGSGTRSSLMWETVRIIGEVYPKYVVWENVKGVLNKKNKHNFKQYLDDLESLGYFNYYKVLNAKDYGVPQNRERIFIVSIRKDIDDGTFEFPESKPLNITLQDILDKNVDSKYNVSSERVESIKNSNFNQERTRIQDTEGVCGALLARDYKDPKLVKVSVSSSVKPSVAKNFEREKCQIATSDKEIYQCDCDSGWQDNKVGLKVSPTLRANNHHTSVLDKDYVIRKITPLESWRLMGFEDEDYWKARRRLEEVFYNGNDRSDTQMYKQAGNSIVVNVLEELFKSLFKLAD